jgi:outer membrane biosynthesis protein TonB
MRKAALYSAGLHLLVIAFTLLGLPALFSSRFEAETAIVVEVVTMAEKPAAQPATPPKPQPPPQAPKVEFPPEPPAPEPPPPPAAEKVPPPPEPKAEPKPEPPKPIAKPEPPKPDPQPKPTPPQEVAKAVPEPQRKPQPPKPDEFETLLKDLARERDARRPPPTPAPQQRPQPQVAARSAIDEQRLAASIGQMVMSQIQRCWSIPSGVKDVEKTTVTVRISLSPDGSLAGAPVVESHQRMSEDPTFRTVAESALRALRNQRCMPLKLPYEHYETWKYIALNFDPKELSQ